MDTMGQGKRKHPQNSGSQSSRKLLKGWAGTRSCNSATEYSPLTDKEDLGVAAASQVTHANELAVIPGATYEINQKNLPSDAPEDLRSIRAVLLTEVTGQHITVNYPSIISLNKFFAKAGYAMNVENTPRKLTRYTLQLGSVEPLLGTKPELDEKYVMSPRIVRRVLTRPISCMEYLHQAHLKSFWLSASDSTQSSEAFYKLAAAASSASNQDSDALNEPLQKMRKDSQSTTGVKEEQVTQDLCTNYQNVSKQSPKLDVTLWKSRSTSLNGMELRQSGLSPEEDDGETCDAAVTVETAAELLTHLTYSGNNKTDGQSPGITSVTYSLEAGEEPIRWGFRKKVSYDSRRSMDSCDLGLGSGVLHQANEENITTVTAEPDQKLQDTYGSYDFTAKKWEPSTNPVTSEVYRQLRSPVEAGGLRRKPPSMTPQGQRDRPNKLPSSRATVNILKLPKDMQGRWSSERYKSAQLKLIDIMHARNAVPGKPILRPALREEARKHIGDTGLLDHLLKHMTDTVVSTGERFRRRHNSEGAMEYWLEHASLMELRKAAGVEDPSWIPPPGWKPGDRLPGRHWHMSRGMTTSEAAELKHLKETVEKLKSEMKVLCGRIKGLNQNDEMASCSAADQKRLQMVSVSKVDEDMIEGIRKEIIGFKAELTTLQEQFKQEQKTGSNFSMTLERFQKLESEVQQITEDQRLQQEFSSSGNIDLEGQLQDVRQAVTMMQVDVSCIIRILGFAPPPLVVKAIPMRHLLDSSTVGNPMPLAISNGEDTCVPNMTSTEPRPPGTSPVHKCTSPKHEVPMRQCTGLKSATSSSTGGNTTDDHMKNLDEELSRALSNYSLVNQWPQTSYGTSDHKNPSASSMVTDDSGTPVLMDNGQKQAADHTPPQDHKGLVRSIPTGFEVWRPPGSFIWPSMMNLTHFNPNKPSKTMADVLEIRAENGLGNGSPGASCTSASSAISSSMQANCSARSIAESQVAATMAGMFGCMAPQQAAKPPDIQVPGSNNCVFLPRLDHPSQRLNYNSAPRGHTGSTGVHTNAPTAETRLHAGPPRQKHAQRSSPICQTRYPAGNLQQQCLGNTGPSPATLTTLPLMTREIEMSAKETMETATNTGQCPCPSSVGNKDPATSLSLSLSLASSIPGIHCGKPALKK